MDRFVLTENPDGILDVTVRDQIPIVADPEQAEALLNALIAALATNTGPAANNIEAEFRAGALWQRKGRDTGGDLSPLVAPSPHRDSIGDDEVYLSVAVRIQNPSSTPELKAFIEQQRQQSERNELAKLEAQSAQHRQALDAEQSAIDTLQARAAELRAAIDR